MGRDEAAAGDVERLFDLALDMLCVAGADGRLLRVNPAWERWLGWTPDDLIGRPYLDLVHPRDRERTVVEAARLREPGYETVEFENRYRHRDGSYRWLAWNARADADGREIYAVGRDITERRKGDGPRRAGSGFYRSVVESSDDAILSKDRDGRITTWNPGAERLYGYSAAEAVGRPVSLIIPPGRRGEEYDILETALRGERVEHYETERLTKDGRMIEVSLSVSPLRDEAGELIGATAIARDTTARKELERHLRYMADHDALTGLFNRRRFAEELHRRTRHSGRYGRPGALLIIDLDNFKLINDSLGHPEGDRVMLLVAKALSDRARETDVLARLGGDEFAVLLDELDPANAREVARDLLGAVAFTHEGITVTASIGIAPFDALPGATAEDLMIAADVALYEAKGAGRNQIVTYSGRRSTSLRWVDQIRRALAEQRLVVVGQPILHLRSGEVTQQELLVRMRSAGDGLIPATTFLPTAERFGLIRDIDSWVIDQGVGLAAEGRPVDVNLSAATVGDREIANKIEARLSEANVRPDKMVFEITETAAIANMDEAYQLMQRLRTLGCGVALDDFGTGFGSFSSLKRLPISYLKIDAEFVRHLKTDRANRHVVEAVVRLAHGLGQKTIAEGVEDQATLAALVGYGVDLAQGFHIGRPGPVTRPRRRRPFARRRLATLTRAA